MNFIKTLIIKNIAVISIIMLISIANFSQNNRGELQGIVTDELGAIVIGAEISIYKDGKIVKTTSSDKSGKYKLKNLIPQSYVVRISFEGFADYENQKVKIVAGQSTELKAILTIKSVNEQVSVGDKSELSTEADRNLGAIVLKEKDLKDLPDNREDLTAVLQALAGPAAGPNGTQIYVDGFSGGEVPQKDTIREVRINQNPFSAEFSTLGLGRIQIFTRPGSNSFRATTFFHLQDKVLNSRSPFVEEKGTFQTRNFGGFISGPIIKNKASFTLFANNLSYKQSRNIRATTLNSNFEPVTLNDSITTPRRINWFNPRIDYQINKNHTFTARYRFNRVKEENAGAADISLASRAYDLLNKRHTLQLTETAIINESVVNETRFQYFNSSREQKSTDASPSINVLGAFNGGGSPIGESSNVENRIEISNITTWAWQNHAFRAGVRIRNTRINNFSPQNFNGTYTFAGGIAPALDENNQIVLDTNGQIVAESITSLERYRRTLFFANQGFTPAQIRTFGGGATQFLIAGGEPQAKVKQTDFSVFWQDDWRIHPDFMIGLGIRYEAQTNVSNNSNFAPRIAFAWSPEFGKKDGNPLTVIRGGFGIFYSRIGQNLTLQENRFNGVNQQRFIVDNPFILDSFPSVPSVSTLEGFATPQTIRQVADDIQSPYSMQSSISLEQKLPLKLNLTATFINTRNINVLRSRNINAPLNGNINGTRPLDEFGNIYQYESSGFHNQRQLIINLRNQPTKKLFFAATYTLNKANSDTDGIGTFPINSFDLSNEYGRSSLDIRHRLFIRSAIGLGWGVRLNNFILASSGRPFNITTGRDTNGDSLFTERPAFATDLTRDSVVITPYGNFDTDPLPEQEIIPRNFGRGPMFFSLNTGMAKTFGVGPKTSKRGRGRFSSNRKYNLTVSVMIANILNRVNLSTPISNLSSPLFGQSTSIVSGWGSFQRGGLTSNRRVNLHVSFSF